MLLVVHSAVRVLPNEDPVLWTHVIRLDDESVVPPRSAADHRYQRLFVVSKDAGPPRLDRPFSRSGAAGPFTPEFEEKLGALKSDEARASEMEHAIKNEIHVKLDENPAFFRSLRERLEQIIKDRKTKRIDAAQQLKLFEALTREIRGHGEAAEQLGLSETSFAIYGLIAEPKPLSLAESPGTPYVRVDEAKKALASILEEQLVPQVAIVDWHHKDDVQREMRRLIKRQLRAASYPIEKIDTVAESVVDLMKRRRRS